MKKLWILTLTVLLMTGCRPDIINIKQAMKQTVFPGRKEAPINIKYTVQFDLSKPVQLEMVHFKNANTTFEIEKFLLKNLDTKEIFSAHKTLPAGNYVFEAGTLKKPELESNNDVLIFTVKLSGKNYDYKVKLQQGDNVFMP